MIAAEIIEQLREVGARFAEAPATERAKRFTPPYTSMSVNTIQGGTAINILAAICEFGWDVRSLPGGSATEALEEINRFSREKVAALEAAGKHCSIQSNVLANVPPLDGLGGVAEALAHAVSETQADSITVPFATEGGQFQRAGWSTVVCRPRQHRTGSQGRRVHRALADAGPAKRFWTARSRRQCRPGQPQGPDPAKVSLQTNGLEQSLDATSCATRSRDSRLVPALRAGKIRPFILPSA